MAEADVQLRTARLGADRRAQHRQSRRPQAALDAPAEGRVGLDGDYGGSEIQKRLGPVADVRADIEREPSVRQEGPEELPLAAAGLHVSGLERAVVDAPERPVQTHLAERRLHRLPA